MPISEFSSLTYRGQTGRLRRMAVDALAHYDIAPERVSVISNHLNGVFRVDARDGSRWVLRVSVPGDRTVAEIESEMDWLDALHRDTDVAPNTPIHARDGQRVVTVSTEGVPEPRHCVLLTWVPGPLLADRLTTANVEKMGVLSATLHGHSAAWQPPERFALPRFDRVFVGDDPTVMFEPDHAHLFTPERHETFTRMLAVAEVDLARLFADQSAVRVIHGDLHHENVKVDRGRLRPIDFAEVSWGFPVQDIAMTFYDFRYFTDPKTHSYADLCAAFRRGYERTWPWPEEFPGQIDIHQMAHRLMVANWVLLHADPTRNPWFYELLEREFRELLDTLDGSQCMTVSGVSSST